MNKLKFSLSSKVKIEVQCNIMNKQTLKSRLVQAFIVSAASILACTTPSLEQQPCPSEAQKVATQFADGFRNQIPDNLREYNPNAQLQSCSYNSNQNTLTINFKLSATHPI